MTASDLEWPAFDALFRPVRPSSALDLRPEGAGLARIAVRCGTLRLISLRVKVESATSRPEFPPAMSRPRAVRRCRSIEVGPDVGGAPFDEVVVTRKSPLFRTGSCRPYPSRKYGELCSSFAFRQWSRRNGGQW